MARNTEFPVKKLIGLTPDMMERIMDFRFQERFATEAEAIRTLLDDALRDWEERRKKRPISTD